MKSPLTFFLAAAVVAVLPLPVNAQWMSIGGPGSTVVVPIPRGPAAPLFEPAPTPAPVVVYPLSPAAVYPLAPVPPTPAVEPAPEITLPTGRWERHGDGVSSPHVWVWIPTYPAELQALEAEPSQPTSRPVR